MVEQGEVHGGHPGEERDPVALHDLERLLGREAGQQREGAAPAAMVAFWMQVWPKEWNSGRVARATWLPSTGISRGTTTAQLISRLEWVSSAPLGLTGGARGVEDYRSVVGTGGVERREGRRNGEVGNRVSGAAITPDYGHSRLGGAVTRGSLEERVAEEQLRPGILQVVGDLGR